MSGIHYFSSADIATIEATARWAAELSFRYFGLDTAFQNNLQYGYRTLADLRDHEIIEHGFAHLVRYRMKATKTSAGSHLTDFYSICLQDHRILDVVKNRGDGIRLKPLLLYIITHEMIHIIRFSLFARNFLASPHEKEEEEKNVHTVTFNILSQLGNLEISRILDLYSHLRNSSSFTQSAPS